MINESVFQLQHHALCYALIWPSSLTWRHTSSNQLTVLLPCKLFLDYKSGVVPKPLLVLFTFTAVLNYSHFDGFRQGQRETATE